MPETSQHFFYGVIRPGLADKRKRGKLFLKKFPEPRHEFETRFPHGSPAAFAFCVADPIGTAHESRRI
jgi:hypothetical protein